MPISITLSPQAIGAANGGLRPLHVFGTEAMKVATTLAWTMLAVTAAGCTQNVTLGVWRPAEFDVTGINRLAVLDFDGPGDSGRTASSALVSQLWENGHYQLVNQSELGQAAPVASPQGGPPNVQAALEAARAMGVDAVLTGRVVSYDVSDDVFRSHRFEVVDDDYRDKPNNVAKNFFGVGFESNETLNREGSVSLAFRLVDARTGQIRAARQTAHSFNGQMINGEGDLPGRQSLLTDLLHECTSDVVVMLAPHREYMTASLSEPYFVKGSSDVRRGNKLASNGDWQGAERCWEAALEMDPENHAAIHNLAVARETRHDYHGAQQLLSKALKIKNAGLYAKSLKRIAAESEQYRLASLQFNTQNQAAPSGLPFTPASHRRSVADRERSPQLAQ